MNRAKECKCDISTMTKIGFDYVCNKCKKIVVELDDSNFDDKYDNLSPKDDIFDQKGGVNIYE